MLVQFSVKNYRSIYEKQTLSFVADSEQQHPQVKLLKTGFKDISLLPCLGIYGINGSGKTILIEAIGVMRGIILCSGDVESEESETDPGLWLISPHRLAQEQPTEFEIVFIHEKTLYRYGFLATSTNVIQEWLFSRKKNSQEQKLLFREEEDLFLHAKIKGTRASWKRRMHPAALMLSTVALAEEINPVIDTIHEWFYQNLQGFQGVDIDNTPSIDSCETPQDKKDLVDFLNQFDLFLSDIKFKSFDFNIENVPEMLRGIILAKKEFVEQNKISEAHLEHVTSDGRTFTLNLSDEESDGTKKLFALYAHLFWALTEGTILRIDDLDSNLHHFALRSIFFMFADEDINQNNAQLIFSVHNVSTFTTNLFRTDQIWKAIRNENLSSVFTPHQVGDVR
jgi:uncharacterized protein